MACIGVGRAQDGRRMNRRQRRHCEQSLEHAAAVGHQAKRRSKEGLRRGGAERDDERGADNLDLRFEPRVTGSDFDRARLSVNAALAANDELEVLDGVSDVDVALRQPGCFHGLVEHLSGWSHKGMPQTILTIPRLFADEHAARPRGAFTKDGLSGGFVEIAAAAAGRCGAKTSKRAARR